MVSNKKAFGLGLPGCLHLRHTQLPDHKFVVGQPETGAELAEDLQRFVDLHGADSIARSEEHTSELQSLMRISYAVFCLKKKKRKKHTAENKYNENKVSRKHTEEINIPE